MCPSSGADRQADSLHHLTPEDGGIKIVQNIRNYLAGDSVSPPRRLEFNVVSSVESTVIK
jgi:hypothetical protein